MSDGGDDHIGLCDAIYSGRLPISYTSSVECLRHEATDDMVLDVARIMPAMGPMIDSAEAIVIVVGGQHSRLVNVKLQLVNATTTNRKYDSSDINASMFWLHRECSIST